jgi:hypothetical protein
MWFRRKIDFSGMADGDTKVVNNVYGKGTITAVSGVKNVSMSASALQCFGWSDQLLATFHKDINTDHNNINATRQRLPHFMLERDLEQLKQNVHLYILWGNRKNTYTQQLNGKYFEITLNLFAEKDNK